MSSSPRLTPIAPHPLITVSGFASGVGKTTLAEWLIRRLAPIAALKVTVVDSGVHACPIQRSCGVCSSLRTPYRVLIEHRAPTGPGAGPGAPKKDTARLAHAGADPVVWVQTRGADLDAALEAGLARVGERGVVIEGNTAVTRLEPDLALMVDRPGRAEIKPSARAILDRMHAILLNAPGPAPREREAGCEEAVDDARAHAGRALVAARLEGEMAGLEVHVLDLRAPGRWGESVLGRLVSLALTNRHGAVEEAKSNRGC